MGNLEEARAVFKSSCRTYQLACEAGLPMWSASAMRDDAAAHYMHLLQRSGIDVEQLLEMYEEISDDIRLCM